MTYEELLDVKLAIEKLEHDMRRYNVDVHEYVTVEELVTAIQCVEKQIPKKPCVTDAYPHRVYCECGFTFAFNKDNAKVMGDLVQYDYCPCCGQKIDWSDYN